MTRTEPFKRSPLHDQNESLTGNLTEHNSQGLAFGVITKIVHFHLAKRTLGFSKPS